MTSPFDLDDIVKSELSSDFMTVLEAASEKNSQKIIEEINDINVLQALQELSAKKVKLPDEATSFQNDKHLKFILGLNKFCQTHLKRPPGIERQQVLDGKQYSVAVRTALDNMGFVSEVKPLLEKYDTQNIFGGNQNGVRLRLEYLLSKKITADETNILGSDRKLWPIAETMTSKLVANEKQGSEEEVMKKFIEIGNGYLDDKGNVLESVKSDTLTFGTKTNAFRKAVYENEYFKGVKWPTEMDVMRALCEERNIKCTPIIALCPAGKERADTGDTLQALAATMLSTKYDERSNHVFVSGQPHVRYQQTQIQTNLPSTIGNIQTIGYGVEDFNTFNVSVVFDALASTVYCGLPILVNKAIVNYKALLLSLDDGVTFGAQVIGNQNNSNSGQYI